MENGKKLNSNYMIVLCLFLYLAMGATSLISPVLADLSAFYAGHPTNLVNLIVTLPSLTAIVGCLIFGPALKIGYKKALLIGYAVILISSVAPYFFAQNLYAVIISRGVVGLAFGFLLPSCSTTITRLIAPEKQGTIMGWGSTFLTIVLVLITNLVPVLLKVSIQTTFLIHLFLLVPLLFLLPVPAEAFELHTAGTADTGEEIKKQKTEKFGKKSWFWQFVMLLNTIFYYPFSLYISYVVANLGGDAAAAALATSVAMVSGAIGGAVFGLVKKKMNRVLMIVAAVLMVVGFFLSAAASSVIPVYAGSFLIGLGNIFVQTNIYATIPSVTPAARIGSANGNVAAFQNIGAFISPLILTGILSLFGKGDSYQTIYYISAGFYVLAVVLFAVIGKKVTE